MRSQKHPTLTFLAAILFICNSLTLTAVADDVFNYKVETFPEEITIETTVNGEKLSFEDDYFLENEGAPEIPYKIVRLALPSNTSVSAISAIGGKIENFASGVDHAWFEGDIMTDISKQYTPASKNTDLYSSSELFPGKYVEILNKGMMGSQSFATLAVYPVQYRPSNGDVILIGEIDIQLNLQLEDGLVANRVPKGTNLLADIVDNPEDMAPSISPSAASGGDIPGGIALGIGGEYIIITTAELAPAFYPYAIWKNQKGLLTELVLLEDILQDYSGEDAQAQVRSYLQDAYVAGAQWVLLGGDENIIPTRYAYPGNVSTPPTLPYQQATDLYYADLTGNWDTDGDGIYGEYLHDDPDIYPEVYVGRVPAANPEEVQIWVEKALLYEQNPGGGDYSYLTKGLFISSDQLRDLNEHITLASLMPENFEVDYSRCAEEPSGGSQNPTQPTAETIIDVMSEGWGFISNLNHGGFYYYAAMTPYYNHAPRSNVWGDTIIADNGASSLTRLEESNKYGIHYSISCYTGAYDFDTGPWGPGPFITNNSFMEAYLFEPNKGGVGFLGNTRWGWVTSSFLLEKKFIEYVYSDTARNLAIAEALSKIYYPNKRDIGYGHNLFGDPEMIMWAVEPTPLNVTVPTEITVDTSSISVLVSTPDGPAGNINVCLWKPGELYIRGTTDSYGVFETNLEIVDTGELYVTAVGADMIPDIDTVMVNVLSSIDNNTIIPDQTLLFANYPNPFNSVTSIKFSLANPGQIKIEIYDISGRLVKILVDNDLPAGVHNIIWNCKNEHNNEVASGTYLYRLKTADADIVKKMVLLK